MSNTYRLDVLLTNVGNTRIDGTLLVDKTRTGEDVVDPDWITPTDQYVKFGVNRHAELTINVEFDEQPLRDRHWRVPLRLQTRKDGEYIVSREISISQQGALGEAIDKLRALRAWGGRTTAVRNGVLTVGAVVLLCGGIFLGMISRPESNKETASSTDKKGVETPISTTLAPVLASNFYQSMKPCRGDKFVVLLQTLQSGSDIHVKNAFADVDRRTRNFIQDYRVKATKWGDVCQKTREVHTEGQGGDLSWRVLWLGPVDSQAAGGDICRRLQLTNSYDCVTRPTG